jgi:hypothetical protein
VKELGVDSVTDDSNGVVGSESGEAIDEGPGKGGGTDLMALAEDSGNSEGGTEGLATDSGSEMFLAIIVVDGELSMSVELIVGELMVRGPRGEKEKSGSTKIIGGPGIGSAGTTGWGTGIAMSSPERGRGTACTTSSLGAGTTCSPGPVTTGSTGSGTAT